MRGQDELPDNPATVCDLKFRGINKQIHSFGLQSIADIKLNDIENTNAVALYLLTKMGFDGAIANPFIGTNELASLVHSSWLRRGIIALIYMSHPGAKEGFGLKVQGQRLYKAFLGRAENSGR